MQNKALSIFILVLLMACKSPEPRAPIVKKSGQFLKESVIRNKAMQKQQEDKILAIMDADTGHTYLSSSNGFWYYYEEKKENDTMTPQFGDLVKFNYNILTLDGKTLYSKEEIGNREYAMDQEDLFVGMRKGLKLMKVGETVTFLFPSSVAFGYYGDNDKIGHNIPIKSTVTVKSITPNDDL